MADFEKTTKADSNNTTMSDFDNTTITMADLEPLLTPISSLLADQVLDNVVLNTTVSKPLPVATCTSTSTDASSEGSFTPPAGADSEPLQVHIVPEAARDDLSEDFVGHVISYIKLKSSDESDVLVQIEDLSLTYKVLKVLTDDSQWLDGDIVSAYIYHLKAQELGRRREGGQVFMETSIISGLLKRDGDEVELNPSDRTSKRIIEMVEKYVAHDMVFIPINVKDSHWYLAVIKPNKRCIQVIDSLGAAMNRDDLTDTITGFQKYIDFATKMKELKNNRWPDLRITEWEVTEQLHYKTQIDRSSCALFMLKYMENWMGDELSEPVIQKDMPGFRRKLAAILFNSELNRNYYFFIEYDLDSKTVEDKPTPSIQQAPWPDTSKIMCTPGAPGAPEVTVKRLCDGLKIDRIILVGVITNIEEARGDVYFQLDDGTGILNFVKWVDDDVDAKQVAAIKDDMYVFIVGTLTSIDTVGVATALTIRPIADYNEVTCHFLKCIRAEIERTK